MNYYYLDENNRPTGPLPLSEVRAKAAAGAIARDPLVAPEGASQWQPLSAAGASGGFKLDRVLPDAVAAALQWVRNALAAPLLKTSAEVAGDVGHYGVIAAAALAPICAIIGIIRSGSATPLVPGLMLLVGVVVAQYVAARFFAANEALLSVSTVRISSLALLDCVALLALLGAVAILVGAIVTCIQFTAWQPLPPALVTAALWVYFAGIALHPESVNVSKGEAGGGEEAIGLMTFFLRAMIKILPVYFFLLVAVGVLIAALGPFDLAGPMLSLTRIVPVPFAEYFGVAGGFAGVGLVITACLLPLFGYAGYLLCSLPLDLWRALLSLPGKVDALKR